MGDGDAYEFGAGTGGQKGRHCFSGGLAETGERYLPSQIIKCAVSFPASLPHSRLYFGRSYVFFLDSPVTSVGPGFLPVLLTLLAGWLSQACDTSGGLGV